MKIELSLGFKQPYKKYEVEKGTAIEEIAKAHRDEMQNDALLAFVNNSAHPLSYVLEEPCKVMLLDLNYKGSYLAYQQSLIFLLLKAAHDVASDIKLEVQASLNEGIFIQTVPEKVDEDTIAKIYFRMKELVSKDAAFEMKMISKKRAQEIFIENGMEEKVRILEKLKSTDKVRMSRLIDEVGFFYSFLVPSTGYLKAFELMKYRDGMLIRFPQQGDPSSIPPFVDEYIMYNALKEQREWNKLLGIKYEADINDKVRNGELLDMILLSEALHDQKVVDITEKIIKQKKRIVLILGPSSSGKTTFARRMMIQLKVNGFKPLYVGTDDYFVDREETPVDANGEPDFENIEALDLKLFNEQMNALLKGEEVDMPVFNFFEGRKEYGKRITTLEEGQPIVIEGIHAFNPLLTREIDDNEKFKIYISPLTQINLDSYNRLPTTDARLIRRIVRDARTRGYSAEDTLKAWNKVRAGEEKNIFPYSSEADEFFNTVHVYEMGILKKYVAPLLREIKEDSLEYSEARRLLGLLWLVDEIDAEEFVSGDSILREFIGGGIYDKL